MVATAQTAMVVVTQQVHVVLAQRAQQQHKQIVLLRVVPIKVITRHVLAILVEVAADAQQVKLKTATATVVQKRG
jgi:hypothetical protein